MLVEKAPLSLCCWRHCLQRAQNSPAELMHQLFSCRAVFFFIFRMARPWLVVHTVQQVCCLSHVQADNWFLVCEKQHNICSPCKILCCRMQNEQEYKGWPPHLTTGLWFVPSSWPRRSDGGLGAECGAVSNLSPHWSADLGQHLSLFYQK